MLGGALQFAAIVVIGRALGAEGLGLIALVMAYLAVVDGLLNFQSVHVLTRCLAEAQAAGEHDRFLGLVRAGFAVDVATACLAAGAAALGLWSGAGLLGLPADWTPMALAAVPIILTRILGTAEAVLRCHDRFGLIGMRGVLGGGLTLTGAATAWAAGAGAGAFLVVILVAEAVANLAMLVAAAAVLRRAMPAGTEAQGMRAAIRSVPGFWRMMWQTNLTFGIRLLSQDGDMLIAGAVLGPQAVGLLRAVKSMTALVTQLGRPIQQVAAAPLARLWAAGDGPGFLRLTLRLSGLAGLAGLGATTILWAIGPTMLDLTYGAEYLAAAPVLTIMMVARSAYLGGVTLLPTMLTLDLDGRFLQIVLMGTAAYFAAMLALISPLGLIGVALSHVAFEVVWAGSGWACVLRRLRRA